MFTYLLMSLPFVIAVLALDWFVLKTRVVLQRRTWIIMGVLCVLTLIFDQFMERYIYHPNPAKSLLFIGAMPVEDLAYTLCVVIGIGMLLTHDQRKK